MKKMIRYFRALKLIHSAIQTLVNIPQVKSLDGVFAKYSSKSLGLSNAVALDIGCGASPRNPFGASVLNGIDIRENSELGIRYADLTVEPIPFDDCTFDYITAHDFLEHVPRVIYLPERRFPFVQLMNEIWRTLKPGGIFFSHTPLFPFSPVFRDPTHVNIITDETFPLYFDDKLMWAKMYGFNGAFKVLDQFVKEPHLVSILQKV